MTTKTVFMKLPRSVMDVPDAPAPEPMPISGLNEKQNPFSHLFITR